MPKPGEIAVVEVQAGSRLYDEHHEYQHQRRYTAPGRAARLRHGLDAVEALHLRGLRGEA